MSIDDGYTYGVSVEYEGQLENMIAKCRSEPNAMMLAQYILDCVHRKPIIRVLNLETKEVVAACQREIKRLDKTTILFD